MLYTLFSETELENDLSRFYESLKAMTPTVGQYYRAFLDAIRKGREDFLNNLIRALEDSSVALEG